MQQQARKTSFYPRWTTKLDNTLSSTRIVQRLLFVVVFVPFLTMMMMMMIGFSIQFFESEKKWPQKWGSPRTLNSGRNGLTRLFQTWSYVRQSTARPGSKNRQKWWPRHRQANSPYCRAEAKKSKNNNHGPRPQRHNIVSLLSSLLLLLFAPQRDNWQLTLLTSALAATATNINMNNLSLSSAAKRSFDNSCNSSMSLDCQSLQASLKRVRLSCSPGELRLQRDVRQLVNQGWNPVGEHCWVYGGGGASSSERAAAMTTAYNAGGAGGGVLRSAKLEQVTQHDPLRLSLSLVVQLAGGGGEQQQHFIMIQIPRMYPHRPPVIVRIDSHPANTAATGSSSSSGRRQCRQVERIVVHEAPSIGQEPPPVSCGTTVVYNQWSPVMQLGDLLAFCMNVFTQTEKETNNANANAASSARLTTGNPSSHHSHSSVRNAAKRTGGSMSQSNPHHARSTPRMTGLHVGVGLHVPVLAAVVEEHKVNEQTFPINRFDAGYGKYLDPLVAVLQSSTVAAAAATAAMCNSMDVS
jgi:hypothetical protein